MRAQLCFRRRRERRRLRKKVFGFLPQSETDDLIILVETEELGLPVEDFFTDEIVEKSIEFGRRRVAVPRRAKLRFQPPGVGGGDDDLAAGGR